MCLKVLTMFMRTGMSSRGAVDVGEAMREANGGVIPEEKESYVEVFKKVYSNWSGFNNLPEFFYWDT